MRLHLLNLVADFFHTQLTQQISYLKCENKILRARLGKCVRVRKWEKHLLLKLGKPLGKSLEALISVVTYRTFQNWLKQKHDRDIPKKVGRRKTNHEIRDIVIQMARNNPWGYTRILGELRKLGIQRLSRSSIKNILKEAGIPALPHRDAESWFNILKRHHDTLLACDFFSHKVWTLKGPRFFFVLFFINLHTRQVELAGITKHPKAAWVIEASRKLATSYPGEKRKRALLIRDRDGKFSREFDALFENSGIQILKTPYRSPNMNAYAESFIDKIRQECLDHFIVFGKKHFQYLVAKYFEYYNELRPHMANDCLPLVSSQIKSSGDIRADPVLGGLHHHYYRE